MVAIPQEIFTWMSEEDYLRTELEREIKHEYIDGYLYAMSGVKKNHARITTNIDRVFGRHLSDKPCESFTSEVKVKIGSKFFYPDVMVVCDDNDQDYYTETPVIIVEVLSPSTRRMDETVKKWAYQNIPTLQEYVLIEQDFVDVEVCRRREGWVSWHYFLGDTVTFEAIGLSLLVEDIYARVDNEDMAAFLANKPLNPTIQPQELA